MKRACSEKKCLNVCTSRGRRSLPQASRHLRTVTLLLEANLTGDYKLKPVLVHHAENPRALKGYDETSLPVHWFANSSFLDDGPDFPGLQQDAAGARAEGVLHVSGPPLLYPYGPQLRSLPSPNVAVLAFGHQVFLPPNTTFLLQLMDQGVIKMFKAHYLQKSWRSLSMKCYVSLDELEESCIRGEWKKLCPHLTVDFGGFDLTELLSKERIKCFELLRKVGLDEVEEDDVDSLLEAMNWRSSGISWRRRWKLSSILRHQ